MTLLFLRQLKDLALMADFSTSTGWVMLPSAFIDILEAKK